MRAHIRFRALGTVVLVAGCAPRASTPAAAPPAPSGDAASDTTSEREHTAAVRDSVRAASHHIARELITQDEIAATPQAPNAYEIVRLLRPMFLSSRGVVSIRTPSASYPVVYVDNMRMGGVEWLRTIPSITVSEIRYLNSGEATTLWGSGHPSGAILVLTKH